MNEDLSVLTRPARAPDATISYGEHADHVADVRLGGEHATERPLVLIVHGGFWRPQYDRVHTGPMAEAIAAAGWTVAAIEYRRIPGDPDITLGDVSDALSVVPGKIAHHNGRVVLIGHSAGGHLVLWLAAARHNAALSGTVALAPAADLRLGHRLNLGDGATLAFLGQDPSMRPDADPQQLPPPQSPTTILHGDSDEVVPLAVGESYVSAHPGVRLVKLPGTGHFAPIDPLSPVWPTVIEELHRMSDSLAR